MNQNQETINSIIYVLSDVTGNSEEDIHRHVRKYQAYFAIEEKQALELIALQRLPILLMEDEEISSMRDRLDLPIDDEKKDDLFDDAPLESEEFLQSVTENFQIVVEEITKLWQSTTTSVLSICKELESSFQHVWIEEFYDLIYIIGTSNYSHFLGRGVPIQAAIKGLFEYIKYALTGTDHEYTIAWVDEVPEVPIEIEQVPEKALELLETDLKSGIPPKIPKPHSYAMAVVREISLDLPSLIELDSRTRIRLITPFEWNSLCYILEEDTSFSSKWLEEKDTIQQILEEIEYYKNKIPEEFTFTIIEAWEPYEIEHESIDALVTAMFRDGLASVKKIEDVISCIRLVTDYQVGTDTVYTSPGYIPDKISLPPGRRQVSVRAHFRAPIPWASEFLHLGHKSPLQIGEDVLLHLHTLWKDYRALQDAFIVEDIRDDIQSALTWFDKAMVQQSYPEKMFYLWTCIERLFRGGKAALSLYRASILSTRDDGLTHVTRKFEELNNLRNGFAHGRLQKERNGDTAFFQLAISLVGTCLRNAIFVATRRREEFEKHYEENQSKKKQLFRIFIDECVVNANKRKELEKHVPSWSWINLDPE